MFDVKAKLIILVTVFSLFSVFVLSQDQSITITKRTTDGELIEINVLEQEVKHLISLFNQYPKANFETIIDDYFPNLNPSENSSSSAEPLFAVHIPSLPNFKGGMPKDWDVLFPVTFVHTHSELFKTFSDLKSHFLNIVWEVNGDMIIHKDKPAASLFQVPSYQSGNEQPTIVKQSEDSFYVTFRRRFLMIHLNGIRISVDGFSSLLMERNNGRFPNKRSFLIKKWHEIYNRKYFVYQSFGERVASPYENAVEDKEISKLLLAMSKFIWNHENDQGVPGIQTHDDTRIGYTPKRILERNFPLTQEDVKKLPSDARRIISEQVEFAFPMNSQPVTGYEKAKLFYSSLIHERLVNRAYIYLTSPLFQTGDKSGTVELTYLLYPKNRVDAIGHKGHELPKGVIPVTCKGVLSFELNFYEKITKFHFYFDLDQCLHKIVSKETEEGGWKKIEESTTTTTTTTTTNA